MLEILKNPKSEGYDEIRERVFDHQFPWYYNSTSTNGLDDMDGHANHPFYSHIILTRPETGDSYTASKSSASELFVGVMGDILTFNNTNVRFFFTRMSVNCTFPIEGTQFTIPHNDHDFPHTNFICYLTDDHGGGGRTFIEGHSPHKPIKDQFIVFTGKHYMELPKKGRRIIIVGTFITY